ncbi:MAG TPA: protein kinase [Gaiellaceae bacterium]|nr:protein kinase [Gaiellaceae bacterium]
MKVGELVADRYELEELVGEGGMSTVFRARDTVLERRVALKVLHEHHARDPEYVERFRREARAIARLAHPNIVTVIDRGQWRGRQFIVFEHVSGETLKDLVAREGPLPVDRALSLAHQVARALAFAHDAGIVHRDVKPQNVLVDADGAAKVMDFGIARSLDPDDELTQTGTLLGTSDYISPEQASGARVDERSDQYSLGVLLYELLTGEVPYPGPNLMAVAVRHLRDPVPSVRARRPGVPPRVDAIIGRAMAKRPTDRFPSMEAMTAALEASLAEARPLSVPGGDEDTGVMAVAEPAEAKPAPPRRRERTRPRPVAVLLLLAAAGALVAGLVAAQMGRDDPGDEAGGGNGGDGSADVVRLAAVRDFDPEGDNASEHPEDVPAATDGDPETFWRTETYSSFSKSGVGIVLAAPEAVALSRLVVVSGEPGYRARIQAGSREDGPFTDVSEERVVGERTAFRLDTGGDAYRYYVVWITDPNGRATVNEVRAR